mmetsp:Transcript_11489/g.42577  ORF Transcript_11489/g.42577 Transcript_11489/m.42577 type:complete len:255 (-) Transcript_11489:379-1143(-)
MNCFSFASAAALTSRACASSSAPGEFRSAAAKTFSITSPTTGALPCLNPSCNSSPSLALKDSFRVEMTRSFMRMYSHPARARASFLLFTEAAITFALRPSSRIKEATCFTSSIPASGASPRLLCTAAMGCFWYHVRVRPTYTCTNAAPARAAAAACSRQYTCVTWHLTPCCSSLSTANTPCHVHGILKRTRAPTSTPSSRSMSLMRSAFAQMKSASLVASTTSTETDPVTRLAIIAAKLQNALSRTQSWRTSSE